MNNAIRNVKENKEVLELEATRHRLVYSDDVNLLGENMKIQQEKHRSRIRKLVYK